MTKLPAGAANRTIVPGATPPTRWVDRKPSGIALTVMVMVRDPRPDVAAGAVPPLDVAAGAAPRLDVAAGAAPRLDVAAGAAPRLDVAAGAAPRLDVAAGA